MYFIEIGNYRMFTINIRILKIMFGLVYKM